VNEKPGFQINEPYPKIHASFGFRSLIMISAREDPEIFVIFGNSPKPLKIPIHGLNHTDRFLAFFDFKRQAQGNLLSALNRLDAVDTDPQSHPFANQQRGRKAQSIDPVVHTEPSALEIPDLFEQPWHESQDKIAWSNSPSKGRLPFGPFNVFANPLMVVCCSGIGIHGVLGDKIPIRHANFLPDKSR
jgi:hypothetical protein